MKKLVRKDTGFIKELVKDFIGGNDSAKVILVETLYGNAKDKAHGTEHIYNVLADAKMLKGSNLNTYETLAVIFHDCGNEVDRDEHHNIGAEYINDILKELNYKDRDVVKMAIKEHRASYKGEFFSEVSELLSSADRGKPDNLAYTLKRSYDYAVKHGDSHEDAILHAVDHIEAKYGRNGYAKFPPLYLNFYKSTIHKFWDDIDKLTVEKAKYMIKSVKNV